MAFQFPANPTLGQQFAPATGTTYEWNGTGWIFLGLNTASLYPAGIVLPYAGTTIPFQGWLLCDGASYATAAQPALFAVIQYYYGGSGANFNVPDLRGRVIAGSDNMGGTAANRLTAAGGMNAGTITGVGGAETVALTAAQAPSHAHGITDVAHAHGVNDPTHAHAVSDPGHAHGVNDPGHVHTYMQPDNTQGATIALQGQGPVITRFPENTSSNATGISIQGAGTSVSVNGAGTGIGIQASGTGLSTTTAAGGGQAHANVQPTLVLNYLIKT